MSSSWECNLACFALSTIHSTHPVPLLSLSLLSLSSCHLSNSPNHTVHQVKENVLLLAEEECQLHTLDRFHHSFLTFLFLLFISTRRSINHSPPHSPHISLATPTCKPLALFVSLPPPNRPYSRLPPFSAILSHPAQNLPGSYNQSSISLRPPTNSPPSNSSSVNGLASQSTQQLPPQHQPPPAQSQSLPPPQQQQPRPVYPWTARRLNLLPPTFLSKNAPPSGPSPSPFPRYGHAVPASATPAGELFLFGGLVHDSARNDLYVFSSRDLSATLLQTSGEVPSPRVGHAGALVSSVFLIWGGDTNTGGQEAPNEPQDDSLYLLNLGTLNLSMLLAPAN
jgi:hypothetical protein